MEKLSEYSEQAIAYHLIKQHTIGDLRSESDLNNSKFHALQTLNFIDDLFNNFDGSIDSKLKLISELKNEVNKFYVVK